MYDISLSLCTTNLCHYLLSLLEHYGYDTMWIRYSWTHSNMTNAWCVYKCFEIFNREDLEIPPEDCEEYHIRRI